jgi:hypothetical protein
LFHILRPFILYLHTIYIKNAELAYVVVPAAGLKSGT